MNQQNVNKPRYVSMFRKSQTFFELLAVIRLWKPGYLDNLIWFVNPLPTVAR